MYTSIECIYLQNTVIAKESWIDRPSTKLFCAPYILGKEMSPFFFSCHQIMAHYKSSLGSLTLVEPPI